MYEFISNVTALHLIYKKINKSLIHLYTPVRVNTVKSQWDIVYTIESIYSKIL